MREGTVTIVHYSGSTGQEYCPEHAKLLGEHADDAVVWAALKTELQTEKILRK